MKKLIIGLILLFVFVFAACGQTTYYGIGGTLEWDAASQYEDATPFLPTDVVEYEVYRSVDPVTDRLVPDVFLATVPLTEKAVLFTVDKSAYAIRTKITTDEGNTVLFSEFNWSDITEPGETTPAFLCKRRTDKVPKRPLILYIGAP